MPKTNLEHHHQHAGIFSRICQRTQAEYFNRSPEKLGPEHIRQYQLHMVDRKLAADTIKAQSSALRFLYLHTLRRPYMQEHTPIPKTPAKLPQILSRDEVAQLIDGASNVNALRHSHDSLLNGYAPSRGLSVESHGH